MLSFPSWVPPSTVCDSSNPSIKGFEKRFSESPAFLCCRVGPTRGPALDPVCLFWVRGPLGGPTVDPSIPGRVGMSEPRAVKPLGLRGPQDLPLRRGAWGVGWDLLPSQGRPSSTVRGVQVPLLCLPTALSPSPSGFLLGLPRSLPTFGAPPSPAEGPEPALRWRMPTWGPCCCCPCSGGVSGGGVGEGARLGEGARVGRGWSCR